mgnify:CR=1 FL=1
MAFSLGRALSGVMDRCAKLYMHQRSAARHDETAACRQLLDAAAQEMARLDAWGLTSFIRLAAAVKYLPAEHLAAWRECMLGQLKYLIPQVGGCKAKRAGWLPLLVACWLPGGDA